MKILNSANVASLMNIMLKNARGTTTTTNGAASDGLIVAEDLSNLVDGGVELSNTLTVENFKNVITGMLNGVGRILYENAKLTSPSRFNLFVDISEYLTILEKVRISAIEFEQSYMYATSGGSSFEDMFNNHPLTFTVKVWNTIGSYRTKPFTISLKQLADSARKPEEITRLIGEIYAVVETTYYTAIREAEKRVVMNQAAHCCMYRNGVNCIDVLAAYKAATGTALTTETMRTSDDFKRWMYGFWKHYKMLMGEASGNFNAEQNLINTDNEDMRSFILEPFYTSLRTISVYQDGANMKDAFDGVTEIPFIQNINEPQKININPVDAPANVEEITITDIIGMIWDRRGTMITATDIEAGSQHNDFDKWDNYVYNFGVREMCDKGSNAILFVAHDANGEAAFTIETGE
jgi:hypothetical protein